MKKITLSFVLLFSIAAAWAGNDGRGYLGASIAGVHHPGEGHADDGVYVQHVLPGGGAEKAGLRAGDRIVAIDGQSIGSFDQLREAMKGTRAAQTVNVGFERDGARGSVDVVLGAAPRGDSARFGVVVDEKRAYFGVEIEPLNPQLAEFFGVDGGILITEVLAEGPAEEAGLQAGDIVVEVDGSAVRDSRSLHHALQGIEPGDEVSVGVDRRGSPLTFYVEAGDRASHTFRIDMLRLHEHLDGSAEGNVEIVVPENGRWKIRHQDIDRHRHEADND